MEVCDDVLVFEDVVQRNDPYLHILSPRFYSDRFADTLLTWMENNQDWNHHDSLHYQQYELGFTRFTHCKEIEGLWDGKRPCRASGIARRAPSACHSRAGSIFPRTRWCPVSMATFIPTRSRMRRIASW